MREKHRLSRLKKDFPWLKKVGEKLDPPIRLVEAISIEVKRANRLLLSRKGYMEHYRNANGEFDNYTVFFAETGWKINRFHSSGFCGSVYGEKNEWDANTIGRQLLASGIRPDFILECERSDRNLGQSYDEGKARHFWTIHKMKGFDFDLSPFEYEPLHPGPAALRALIIELGVEEVGYE